MIEHPVWLDECTQTCCEAGVYSRDEHGDSIGDGDGAVGNLHSNRMEGTANTVQKMAPLGERKNTVADKVDRAVTTVMLNSREKTMVGNPWTKAVQSLVARKVADGVSVAERDRGARRWEIFL
jgi:hypothetical protein